MGQAVAFSRYGMFGQAKITTQSHLIVGLSVKEGKKMSITISLTVLIIMLAIAFIAGVITPFALILHCFKRYES